MVKLNSGFNYNPFTDYTNETYIRSMNIVCSFCTCLKWKGELAGLCCSSGKVFISPEFFESVLNGKHLLSMQFLNALQSYSPTFQDTLFESSERIEGNFMPIFKSKDKFIMSRSLELVNNNVPKFLQLHFIADYLQKAQMRWIILVK